MRPNFSLLASGVEFVGALIIAFSALQAFLQICFKRNPDTARLMVAEGALNGLGFKLAATLLNTITLQSWHQILMFSVILALRTALKTDFQWQERMIARRNI